jgi:polyferredoxin
MTHEVPTDRVLSTLNRDGTRRWIRPKLAHGRFLQRRKVVGYALVALFVLLPRLRIAGRPGVLIDLRTGEIDVLGAMFRPSDGFVLALLGVTIVSAVFLLTALWGRVWCGWGCPQTVYLEHVFRPIERWLEGSPGEQRRRDAGRPDARRIAKWALFAVIAFAVANVFLAYFVGVDRLILWITGSPRCVS